jgi:flagellar assembly protein FliH
VDVTDEQRGAEWVSDHGGETALVDERCSVRPLVPLQVPSHPRPDQSPLVESIAPPPPVEVKTRDQEPPKRPDTLIEDLIPRAEEEVAAAIATAIEGFSAARADVLAESQSQLIKLSTVICRRVLHRELTLDPGIIEALILEGLSALSDSDQVTVRLGPFFADAIEEISARLNDQGVACRVVLDPSVGLYGCTLQTELGRVDESLEARLESLLSGLTSDR